MRTMPSKSMINIKSRNQCSRDNSVSKVLAVQAGVLGSECLEPQNWDVWYMFLTTEFLKQDVSQKLLEIHRPASMVHPTDCASK